MKDIWELCVQSSSVSTGSTSEDSTKHEWKVFGGKSYIVVDVYYVVRPMTIVSVLNMYVLFSCHYAQHIITTTYITFTLLFSTISKIETV